MATTVGTDDDGGTSERGVQYPSDNLGDAVGMLEVVRSAIGHQPAKRDLIAKALGYTSMSGRAARKLGALGHYGLLERSGKKAARISKLGESILMPTSESERRAALIEAVRTPKLFAALMSRYTGHALPSLLPNLLAREHGVNPSVTVAAAATFRESVEYAGLLRNGVLHADTESPEDNRTSTRAEETERPEDAANSERDGDGTASHSGAAAADDPRVDPAVGRFNIVLDRSGRSATILMPLPLNERDLQKVGAWVSYTAGSIADDEESA